MDGEMWTHSCPLPGAGGSEEVSDERLAGSGSAWRRRPAERRGRR